MRLHKYGMRNHFFFLNVSKANVLCVTDTRLLTYLSMNVWRQTGSISLFNVPLFLFKSVRSSVKQRRVCCVPAIDKFLTRTI